MKSIDPFSIQSGLLLRGGRAQRVFVLIFLVNTQLDEMASAWGVMSMDAKLVVLDKTDGQDKHFR